MFYINLESDERCQLSTTWRYDSPLNTPSLASTITITTPYTAWYTTQRCNHSITEEAAETWITRRCGRLIVSTIVVYTIPIHWSRCQWMRLGLPVCGLCTTHSFSENYYIGSDALVNGFEHGNCRYKYCCCYLPLRNYVVVGLVS